MDEITQRVRSFYQAYPYPSKPVGVRNDSSPRLLLSYLAGMPKEPRRLRVLDAGCGTGEGPIATASLNPEAEVTAADLNPVALGKVAEEAKKRRLDNLKVQQLDLMTLEGLEIPSGGYDVISCSGVIHHLSDPETGLRHLAKALAPQGVLILMVYGRFGRQPLDRLVEALDLARPARDQFQERLQFARSLLTAAGRCAVNRPPWEDASRVSDIEFADRYLHVHARSYTVEELFQSLERSSLRFLRWIEPSDWSIPVLLGSGPVAEEIASLSPLLQFGVVERLFERPTLELVACRQDARPRSALTIEQLPEATVEWNPMAAIFDCKGWFGSLEHHEMTRVQVRLRPPQDVSGPHARLVRSYSRPCPAKELIARVASESDSPPDELVAALWELVSNEIFFVP
jgi:SAM-dependent methyltransferase